MLITRIWLWPNGVCCPRGVMSSVSVGMLGGVFKLPVDN